MNIQVGKEREGDMIYTLETGEHVFLILLHAFHQIE